MRRLRSWPLSGLLLLCCLPAAARAQEAAAPPTLALDVGGHTGPVTGLFFTPGGRELLSVAEDRTVRVWDVDGGQAVRVLRLPVLGEGGEILAGALSPDGKTLAVGGTPYTGAGKPYSPILLLDWRAGKSTAALTGLTDAVRCLAFDPRGRRLASGTEDGVVHVWDLNTGKRVREIRVGKGRVVGVAFAPDGKSLLAAAGRTAGVWPLDSGGEPVVLPVWFKRGNLHALAWSPDGKVIALANESHIKLFDRDGTPRAWGGGWDGKPGRLMMTNSLVFANDSGSVLATQTDAWYTRVSFFDLAGKADAPSFVPYPPGPRGPKSPLAYDAPATCSAISPNGSLVATAGGKGHLIYLWPTDNPRDYRRLGTPGDRLHRAAWAKDGQAIAWATKPSRPKSDVVHFDRGFDLARLRPAPPAEEPLRGVSRQAGALSVDGAGFGGVNVKREGRKVGVLLSEGGRIGQVTFLPHDLLALANESGKILLFDLKLLGEKDANRMKAARTVLHGHSGRVGLSLSPDEKTLLSYDSNGLCIFWDLEKRARLLSLFVRGQEWIAWTPAGYYAATPGGERLMGWQVNNGPGQLATYYPAERFRKTLYRPDVLPLVLPRGGAARALAEAAEADAARGQKTRPADVQGLLPPQATLTVVDSTALPKLKLRATAVARVKGQPVTALRLLVDGRPLPNREGVAQFAGGKDRAEVEWTVTLPGEKAIGAYHLTVLARGPDASSVSEAVAVRYVNAARLPVLRVLADGINDYEDKALRLRFAAVDARAVVEGFKKSSKGELFRAVDAVALVDREATRAAILRALEDLRLRAGPQDLVVVFFAGHGARSKERFYLLPAEARADDLEGTCISGATLRKTLAGFRSQQVLLLLDACHSAAFGEGRKLTAQGLAPATDELARILTDDECGVAVLCAAMGHEQAEERDGHGLFTRALVEALNQAEGIPFNRHNRRMYIHHLHTFVFDEVMRQSDERQHPFLNLPWVMESFPIRELPRPSGGLR